MCWSATPHGAADPRGPQPSTCGSICSGQVQIEGQLTALQDGRLVAWVLLITALLLALAITSALGIW